MKFHIKINKKDLIKLNNNILKLKEMNASNKFANFLNYEIAIYFLSKSNFIYSLDKKYKDNIILGKIKNYNNSQKLNIKKPILVSPKTKTDQDILELQNRIKKAMENLNQKYKIENELIMFSSLKKGKGKTLINEFEKQLLLSNNNSYLLLTDSLCNWKWYENNNYHLLDKLEIKIDDLINIKFPIEKWYVMIYEKKIYK